MPAFRPSVALHDLTFAWPDGSPAIDHVSGAFDRGRTGLVGLNGVGKSTLLRIIAGDIVPTGGSVTTTGVVDYLPQNLTLRPHNTVADLLGVRGILDAIRAIEGGTIEQHLFDLVGDDWDVEARSVAALTAAGIDVEDLDRPADTLSGGETMLTALVGVSLRRADIALLDEPTNNLDTDARERAYELVSGWRGALIVVSHDVALLELMDSTAELRAGSLSVYGGPYSAYREHISAEQEAAQRALRSAEQTLKTEKRQRVQAEEKIAHSERQGRKDTANRKYVKAVVNDRRNSAEKSQGNRRGILDDKVQNAREAVEQAESRVREDDRISIQLPDPGVPRTRRIARLVGGDGREVLVQGPERIALTGPNGVGKTTLLQGLLRGTDASGHPSGHAPTDVARARAEALVERVGYVSQRLDGLDDARSAIENVRAAAPGVPAAELRNRLARLLLRGPAADRPVGSLSGGERFRAALATLLLAAPPAQLLVLDEPTNNLDIPSVGQLTQALAAYRGALIVVSHDRAFLDGLDLTAELRLDADGALTRVA